MNTTHDKKKRRTKLDKGADFLREAILIGSLRPGQKLTQQDLADELGMSPTPIREILRRLEAEGLVVHKPHKGVYVSEVGPEDIEEISLIRIALESLAVRMAVPRLSETDIKGFWETERLFEEAWESTNLRQLQIVNFKLHMSIYETSGSKELCALIRQVWPRFATDVLWMVEGRTERSIKQHRNILTAIERGTADEAAELLADHISTAGKTIVEFMKKQHVDMPKSE